MPERQRQNEIKGKGELERRKESRKKMKDNRNNKEGKEGSKLSHEKMIAIYLFNHGGFTKNMKIFKQSSKR